LRCPSGRLEAGKQIFGRPRGRRCERERQENIASRAELGALHPVERDHRERSEGRSAFDLGLSVQATEHHEIRVIGISAAGQPGDAQLTVELDSVFMVTGDNVSSSRAPFNLTCDSSRNFSVPCYEPEYRSATVGRVIVAPWLVRARDAGPGGERCEQRQAGGRRRFHGLRHGARPNGADECQGIGILCGCDSRGDRITVAVGGLRDAGSSENRIYLRSQVSGKCGVHNHMDDASRLAG
jgi:hypothetical protein